MSTREAACGKRPARVIGPASHTFRRQQSVTVGKKQHDRTIENVQSTGTIRGKCLEIGPDDRHKRSPGIRNFPGPSAECHHIAALPLNARDKFGRSRLPDPRGAFTDDDYQAPRDDVWNPLSAPCGKRCWDSRALAGLLALAAGPKAERPRSGDRGRLLPVVAGALNQRSLRLIQATIPRIRTQSDQNSQ